MKQKETSTRRTWIDDGRVVTRYRGPIALSARLFFAPLLPCLIIFYTFLFDSMPSPRQDERDLFRDRIRPVAVVFTPHRSFSVGSIPTFAQQNALPSEKSHSTRVGPEPTKPINNVSCGSIGFNSFESNRVPSL